MKRYTIIDIENVEIGSIEDLILDPDSLDATHLILGAGFFEELQEELGNKPNIDEIVDLDLTEIIADDTLRIKLKISDLELTDEHGVVQFPHILYTDLKRYEIYINDVVNDGELHDYFIDGNKPAFIFQFPEFQYKMSMLGYRQKLEFVFPIEKVKIDEKKIKLDITEEDLIAVVENTGMKMTGKSIIYV